MAILVNSDTRVICQHVGRVSRRRNPPPWDIGVGGLRFANPPYALAITPANDLGDAARKVVDAVKGA